MNRFEPQLRSLEFGYLAVVLQPEFEKAVEIDQFDVSGAVRDALPLRSRRKKQTGLFPDRPG